MNIVFRELQPLQPMCGGGVYFIYRFPIPTHQRFTLKLFITSIIGAHNAGNQREWCGMLLLAIALLFSFVGVQSLVVLEEFQ